MTFAVVIEDPRSVYSGKPRDQALQLLGDIEGGNGNNCEVTVRYGLTDLLLEARNQIDAEGHDEDCVLRCLRNECDDDHHCDQDADEEEVTK